LSTHLVVGRVSKICCQQSVMSQQTELIQQKYAVSAKTCWVLKMPGDDSAKICCVSKKFNKSAKMSWFSEKYALSAKTCWVGKNAWWRLNNRIWVSKIYCLSKNHTIQQNMLCMQRLINPQKSLVITQQKYAVSAKLDESAKWADLANIRYVSKNLLSLQNAWWWLNKICWVRKNLLSQQKLAESAKICCVSKKTWRVSKMS